MAPQSSSTKAASGKRSQRLRIAEARVADLTAEVAVLRAEIDRLTLESATWRKKAKKRRSRLKALRESAETALAEAGSAARQRASQRAVARSRLSIADHPRAEPLVLREAPLPEPSWTVARLRVAAREQGVAGYGRMRKDELLAALI